MASEVCVSSETYASKPPLVGPTTTVTPRTASAPRGVIFADKARGRSFWEVAESSEDDDTTEHKEEKAGGNVFRIDWIRWESPLPFHRTREIRNPWNRHREIKVSRDGTEIEPSVGAILLAAFDAKPDCEASGLLSRPPTRHSRVSSPTAQFRANAASALVYPQTVATHGQGPPYLSYGTILPQPALYYYSRSIR